MSIPEADRFWSKVDKAGECWLWTGARNDLGYGSFSADGRHTELAHRTAWRLTQGTIPDGILICHRCDNPPCVRPKHLFAGTNTDNVADQMAKGRRHDTRGTKNGRAKLNGDQIAEIRSRYQQPGVRILDLAAEFGVSKSQIWNIVSKSQWSEYPVQERA